MVFQRYLNGLAGLLFPPVCAACRVPLADGESIICAACWYHLPYTQFHKDPENNSARQLWGRVPIKGITAFLYFHDFSRVQQLVHQLKYRNRPDIGILMGQKYGEILRQVQPYNQADCIVPVPLYAAKLRRRGYNQSACFAHGLSRSMQKPVIEDGLRQFRPAPSQTRKSRYQRFENIRETIEVADSSQLSGKHILLVDDVLTTGATVEACAGALLEDPSISVSVVTLARAV